MKRWLKILITCVSVFLLLCVAGGIWDEIASQAEGEKYPPMGQMVDVFDTRMHVFSSGEPHSDVPTVVLLSGWGTPSPTVDFYPLWSRLNLCVVVLERPGYGWSEETERDRTVANIMEEDREALIKAGFEPPFLLVGHSMGGLEAAQFANSYPNEVSGVVLLDSMAPEITLQSQSKRSTLDQIVPAARSIGLLRLVNSIAPSVLDSASYDNRNSFVFVDSSLLPMERAITLHRAQSLMMRREFELLNANAQIIKDLGFPKQIPLVSLLADVHQKQERYDEMLKAQQDWVNQSDQGELIQIKGEHYLHHFDPDEVCAVIERLATTERMKG